MSKMGEYFLDMQDAHYRNDCYPQCYFCNENEKYKYYDYEYDYEVQK